MFERHKFASRRPQRLQEAVRYRRHRPHMVLFDGDVSEEQPGAPQPEIFPSLRRTMEYHQERRTKQAELARAKKERQRRESLRSLDEEIEECRHGKSCTRRAIQVLKSGAVVLPAVVATVGPMLRYVAPFMS